MSPIAIHQVNRRIPTTLDLNGPVLSFTTQPTGAYYSVGDDATLTGIATVSFPGNSSPDNSGTITYQWYKGSTALSDGSDYTGTATTTLTIDSVASPGDKGDYYLEAAYTPSTETGNAVNEPLKSDTVTVNVYPTITFTTQPGIATAGVGGQAIFSVEASLSDTSYGTLSYQWSRDGTAPPDRDWETLTVTVSDFSG